MVAETNPNHTSMITGAFPERHGIVGNAFATPGAGAERGFLPGLARAAPRSQTTGESPSCLEAETVFTDLERKLRRPALHDRTDHGQGQARAALRDRIRQPGDLRRRLRVGALRRPCAPTATPTSPTNPVSGYAANDAIVMDEVIRTTREGVADAGSQRRPASPSPTSRRSTRPGTPSAAPATPTARRSAAADAELERFVANQQRARHLAPDGDDRDLRPLDGRHAPAREGLARDGADGRGHPRLRVPDRRQRRRRPHLPPGPVAARRRRRAEGDARRAHRLALDPGGPLPRSERRGRRRRPHDRLRHSVLGPRRRARG